MSRLIPESTAEAIANALALMTRDQLAALPAIRRAAQRGGNTAMRAVQREEYALGMAALDQLLAAAGVLNG